MLKRATISLVLALHPFAIDIYRIAEPMGNVNFIVEARAHDDAQWILDQKLTNRVGEWCCGPNDCEAVEAGDVRAGAGGYRLNSGELIPYGETSPLSIDGRLWICRRPDGTRRCVFDRPPGS
jgi:hypothetical protein